MPEADLQAGPAAPVWSLLAAPAWRHVLVHEVLEDRMGALASRWSRRWRGCSRWCRAASAAPPSRSSANPTATASWRGSGQCPAIVAAWRPGQGPEKGGRNAPISALGGRDAPPASARSAQRAQRLRQGGARRVDARWSATAPGSIDRLGAPSGDPLHATTAPRTARTSATSVLASTMKKRSDRAERTAPGAGARGRSRRSCGEAAQVHQDDVAVADEPGEHRLPGVGATEELLTRYQPSRSRAPGREGPCVPRPHARR